MTIEEQLADAVRERDEARAEVERLREMAHDFEAMREDRDHHASALKQERREVERLQGDVWALTTTLRNLPVPSPSLTDACTDAYQRGAEAMREACQQWCRAWENDGEAIADALADLQVEET